MGCTGVAKSGQVLVKLASLSISNLWPFQLKKRSISDNELMCGDLRCKSCVWIERLKYPASRVTYSSYPWSLY